MTAGETQLLVRASRLYYLEERDQAEIARLLGISRPGVSRLLARARKERIVEIRVHDADQDSDWEAARDALGLRELRVARASGSEQPKSAVGRLSARWFLDSVERGASVGLTAGTTLSAFVHEVRAGAGLDLRIVPLVGSLWDTGEDFDVSFLCQELRRRTGGVHCVLSAPAVAASPGVARSLRSDPRVRAVLDEYGKLDVAVLGVARVDKEHPILRAASCLGRDQSVRSLVPRSAQASAGRLFFDACGRPVRTSLDGRTLGISHAELLRVPVRVGLAAGAEKAAAVRALARGKVVNVLIVDESLGRELAKGMSRVP